MASLQADLDEMIQNARRLTKHLNANVRHAKVMYQFQYSLSCMGIRYDVALHDVYALPALF